MKISELNTKPFLGGTGAAANSYVLINYEDNSTSEPVTYKASLQELGKAIANDLKLPSVTVNGNTITNFKVKGVSNGAYTETTVGVLQNDGPSMGDVNVAVNTATSGLASTGYVTNAISGLASTGYVTAAVANAGGGEFDPRDYVDDETDLIEKKLAFIDSHGHIYTSREASGQLVYDSMNIMSETFYPSLCVESIPYIGINNNGILYRADSSNPIGTPLFYAVQNSTIQLKDYTGVTIGEIPVTNNNA